MWYASLYDGDSQGQGLNESWHTDGRTSAFLDHLRGLGDELMQLEAYLFGPSGIRKTGLACQKEYPKSISIEFTKIVKCKCVLCVRLYDFLAFP